MTACFHQGSCASACACAAFALCGGGCCARQGAAARQRPSVTMEEKILALFNTADLPVCAASQRRRSRLCVLLNLQLFRKFKFLLRFFRAAQLAVGLPEQMVWHGVV